MKKIRNYGERDDLVFLKFDKIRYYFGECIFTARKRSLRRLCLYTCLLVNLFTGGGVRMHGRGHAWQGACMAGGMHGRGGGVHGPGGWQGACVAGEGACMAGGMHGWGMCGGEGGIHATHAPPDTTRYFCAVVCTGWDLQLLHKYLNSSLKSRW